MMGSDSCMWGMAGMGLIAILLIIALGLGDLFFNKKH